MSQKPQSVQQLSPNKSLNSSRESSKRKRIIQTNSLPNCNRKTESKAVQPLEPPPPKRSCRRISQITKTSSSNPKSLENDVNQKKRCASKIDSTDQQPRNKAEPQPTKPQSSKVLPPDAPTLKRSCRIIAHSTKSSSNNTKNLKNDVKEDSTNRLPGNKAGEQPVQPPLPKRSYRRITKKSSNETHNLRNDNNQKKKPVSKDDLADQQAGNKAAPKPPELQSSDVQQLEPPPPKRSCRRTCPLTKTSSTKAKSLQNDDNQKKKGDSKDNLADQLPGNKAGAPPPKRSCRKTAHHTNSADQQPGNKTEPPPAKRSYRRISHPRQKTSNKQEKRYESKDDSADQQPEKKAGPQEQQQSLGVQPAKQCNRKTSQPKQASFTDAKSLQIAESKQKRRETIDVSTDRQLGNKAGPQPPEHQPLNVQAQEVQTATRSYHRSSQLTSKSSYESKSIQKDDIQKKKCEAIDLSTKNQPESLRPQPLGHQSPKVHPPKVQTPNWAYRKPSQLTTSLHDSKSIQKNDNQTKRRETIDISTAQQPKNKAVSQTLRLQTIAAESPEVQTPKRLYRRSSQSTSMSLHDQTDDILKKRRETIDVSPAQQPCNKAGTRNLPNRRPSQYTPTTLNNTPNLQNDNSRSKRCESIDLSADHQPGMNAGVNQMSKLPSHGPQPTVHPLRRTSQYTPTPLYENERFENNDRRKQRRESIEVSNVHHSGNTAGPQPPEPQLLGVQTPALQPLSRPYRRPSLYLPTSHLGVPGTESEGLPAIGAQAPRSQTPSRPCRRLSQYKPMSMNVDENTQNDIYRQQWHESKDVAKVHHPETIAEPPQPPSLQSLGAQVPLLQTPTRPYRRSSLYLTTSQLEDQSSQNNERRNQRCDSIDYTNINHAGNITDSQELQIPSRPCRRRSQYTPTPPYADQVPQIDINRQEKRGSLDISTVHHPENIAVPQPLQSGGVQSGTSINPPQLSELQPPRRPYRRPSLFAQTSPYEPKSSQNEDMRKEKCELIDLTGAQQHEIKTEPEPPDHQIPRRPYRPPMQSVSASDLQSKFLLYIRDLSSEIVHHQVFEHFCAFGSLHRVYVLQRTENYNYALIIFTSSKSVELAVAANPHNLRNKHYFCHKAGPWNLGCFKSERCISDFSNSKRSIFRDRLQIRVPYGVNIHCYIYQSNASTNQANNSTEQEMSKRSALLPQVSIDLLHHLREDRAPLQPSIKQAPLDLDPQTLFSSMGDNYSFQRHSYTNFVAYQKRPGHYEAVPANAKVGLTAIAYADLRDKRDLISFFYQTD
ncbi:microtubule-associated protein futsch isoform X2 [Drosophila virilis]|uniref:microtubule-associated protein futsch isoform X2 n=1 Tax=Drosophila virilis TaxID=7244 RepID=UPI0038B3BF57